MKFYSGETLNKTLLLLHFFLLPIILQAQGGIINNGGQIIVSSGAHLIVAAGGVVNQANGSIDNEGFFYLTQDWIQTGASTSYLGMGWMWFNGSTNQILSGVPIVSNLRVDNGQRLLIANDVIIPTSVDLTNNGNIELGANDLRCNAGATIVNYDASNYIITNGTGVLQQEVGGANVVFPVGNSTYNPATLINSGTTDDFTIRVDDQVFDEGTTGPVLTTDVVDRTWLIEEGVVGGSNITMVLQWEQGEELASFDRANSGIAHHLSATFWDNPSSYTAATNVGGTVWSQTRSGFSSFSPFIVRDFDTDLPVEMLYFNAERENANQVQLTWATESETNNEGFEIERMLENESSFSKIAWVDGNETTVNTSYYELLDENTFSGVSYYRLKQIDFDGTFAYSEIRAVEGEEKANDISIFPNPVEDYIHIQIREAAQKASMQIYDSKGALIKVFTVTIQPGELIRLEGLTVLADGMYFLNIQTDKGSNYTKKFEKVGN